MHTHTHRMADSVLTTFIERTRADPALARDLLDATEWNLEAAVSAYHGLYDTKAVEPQEYQYDPSEFLYYTTASVICM